MPRPIWSGSISFGLVNIPVYLYPAEVSKELHFTLLDRRDRSPIGYRKINKNTGKEVPSNDIQKGYEYEEGEYVLISPEELKKAASEATQTIDIVNFVNASEVEPEYFYRPYFVAPQKRGEKSYSLLLQTLKKTKKMGVSKVVIRTKQHLAALIPRQDILVLELLRFDHELRSKEELEISSYNLEKVNDREMKLAEKLVNEMAEKWNPKKYKDDYYQTVLNLIEQKAKTGKMQPIREAKKAKASGKVVDLMPLLRESVKKAGKRQKKTEKRKSA